MTAPPPVLRGSTRIVEPEPSWLDEPRLWHPKARIPDIGEPVETEGITRLPVAICVLIWIALCAPIWGGLFMLLWGW